jgi:hypothetical protein
MRGAAVPDGPPAPGALTGVPAALVGVPIDVLVLSLPGLLAAWAATRAKLAS